MAVPEELRYSSDHEWARIDGNRVRVGITDYAQGELGEVVYAELPELGRSFASAEMVVEVESSKAVSEIFAPVGGTVVAVNEDLETEPERINADPYGGGWLFELEVDDPAGVDGLLDAEGYRGLIGE